jgi:hypothetical protein
MKNMNAEHKPLHSFRRRVVRLSVWTDRTYLVLFGRLMIPLRRLKTCNATSPEDYRCILTPGHDGSHIPVQGREWAWGGNYGRMPR